MRAYLSHWSHGTFGMLAYPKEGEQPPDTIAKAPWFFDDGRELRFMALSHNVQVAVAELRGVSPELKPAAGEGETRDDLAPKCLFWRAFILVVRAAN